MPDYASSPSMRPRLGGDEPARTLTLSGYAVALLPTSAYSVRYVPATAVIGFAFETQTGVHAFASDRAQPFRTLPNSAAYIPAGCEVASRSPHGGEYLTISVADPNRHAGFPERRFNDRIDQRAIAAAQNLRRLILSGVTFDALDIEREIVVLVEAVLRAETSSDAPTAARAMTVHRLKLVDELIDAGLSHDLLVDDIASHLGLSAGFFNRAFKAAIGKTPHDYVLDRRVSRARYLITRTGMPLASVAAACGFASQSHMTTQFQRRLAMTPGALRALS